MTTDTNPADCGIELTRRELEVLTHISEGITSKAVADRLCVSKRTIDFHLFNAYEKLNAGNRVQALRRARALGLMRESGSGEASVDTN